MDILTVKEYADSALDLLKAELTDTHYDNVSKLFEDIITNYGHDATKAKYMITEHYQIALVTASNTLEAE
jgi:hypothetical protein